MRLKMGDKVRFKTREALLSMPNVKEDEHGDIHDEGCYILILECELHLLGKVVTVSSSFYDINTNEDDEGCYIYNQSVDVDEFSIVESEDYDDCFRLAVIEEIVEKYI